MTNAFDDDFFASADTEFDNVAIKKTSPKFARQQFTCEACNGTGLWRNGRVNTHGNAKCNTCHGKGFLVTSPEARKRARVASRTRKENKRVEAMADNQAAIGGQDTMDGLKACAKWSTFANSLLDQHYEGKAWSDKQVSAIKSMVAKTKERAAVRAQEKAEREAAAPVVDLNAIEVLFANASASGYKRPSFRAEGLVIKPGKNSALYVMTTDRMEFGYYGEQPGYEGKIVDSKFHETRDTMDNTLPRLQKIAEDPLEAALNYGRRTGRCACCGRELTKHASIDAGIGPVCAGKWGLA